MKLYTALINELNSFCYGYVEVPIYSVKPQQDGESFDDFLLRVVNSVRRIENSNIHGFIFVNEGNFSKFRIVGGRVVLFEDGKLDNLKDKIF
jgi:hypothetical protein